MMLLLLIFTVILLGYHFKVSFPSWKIFQDILSQMAKAEYIPQEKLLFHYEDAQCTQHVTVRIPPMFLNEKQWKINLQEYIQIVFISLGEISIKYIQLAR